MPGLFCRIQWCLCRNVCRTGAQRPECVAVTHCRSRPCADTALQSSWEGEWDQPQGELGRAVWPPKGWAVVCGSSVTLCAVAQSDLAEELLSWDGLSAESHKSLSSTKIFYSTRAIPSLDLAGHCPPAEQTKLNQCRLLPVLHFLQPFFSRNMGAPLGTTWLSWQKAAP